VVLAAHEVVDELVGHLDLGDLDGVDVEIAHLAQHLVHPLLVDLVLEHHELESEDGHGDSPSREVVQGCRWWGGSRHRPRRCRLPGEAVQERAGNFPSASMRWLSSARYSSAG